jgi:hypothetical protein
MDMLTQVETVDSLKKIVVAIVTPNRTRKDIYRDYGKEVCDSEAYKSLPGTGVTEVDGFFNGMMVAFGYEKVYESD